MTRQEILAIAKPILFNTEMVGALLEGRKTVTRRVVKPQPVSCVMTMAGLLRDDPSGVAAGGIVVKPPCQVGDYLYVRETWTKQDDIYKFLADNLCFKGIYKFSPSIHMPREAARLFLRVTDVRLERLQEATLYGFLDEGVSLRPEAFNDPDNAYLQARHQFSDIWDSTVKKSYLPLYGWRANPWVWVIEFERVVV